MHYIFKEAATPNGLSDAQIREMLAECVARENRPIKKALILPPDISRFHSYAGPITKMLVDLLPGAHIDIMPALGTHIQMSDEEIDRMFPGLPHDMFVAHDWRNDVQRIGEIPADFVQRVSGGLLADFPIQVELNRRLLDPSYDLILSVGQVVPHEVVGMANYNKNLFVGCGGHGIINRSHFLGAIYGMENLMGRDNTPVHQIFDYAEENFCRELPVRYVLTTIADNPAGGKKVCSLAVGRDREMFSKSIKVSQENNLIFLDEPVKKFVVYLDPEEFHTCWIGNKAIYRTRMAIADGGELVVLGPAIHRFGEDLTNDKLIRKYGFIGRDAVLKAVRENDDIAQNLSTAAHLIHSSPDGRFRVTYAPGRLTREETEAVGFAYMPLEDALAKYDVNRLKSGPNTVDGEEIFFVPNPALGLWANRERFENARPGH